ncbi:hypothetical protein TNCV_1900171 [Trichonephila clavipes]|nr:hypothetical protein TNCV_1900171 [Trichonephila clavipes]
MAEEYKLGNFKDVCFTFLKNNLSLSNIFDVIKLAYLYNEDNFWRAVEKFFLDHDTTILNSKMWKELKRDNPREALNILERAYMRKIDVSKIVV